MSSFSDEGSGWGMYGKQRTTIEPCAEARLWKSEEGTLAVFFANYVDGKVNFPYRINPADYGLTEGKWQIKEIGMEISKSSGAFTGIVDRTESSEPGTIKVIELVPLR